MAMEHPSGITSSAGLSRLCTASAAVTAKSAFGPFKTARYGLGRPAIVRTIASEIRPVDGSRLGELLREGCGVVLDFAGHRTLRDTAAV